jgi:hypothetical protein
MRPTRTITAPLAAVLAAATLATPAIARPSVAAAQPSDPVTPSAQNLSSPDARDAARTAGLAGTTSRPRQDLRSPDARDAAAGRGTLTAPEVTVIKVPSPAPSAHGGVDWADAAIGAAGAAGLLAISLAGVTTLRRRHSSTHAGAAIS